MVVVRHQVVMHTDKLWVVRQVVGDQTDGGGQTLSGHAYRQTVGSQTGSG